MTPCPPPPPPRDSNLRNPAEQCRNVYQQNLSILSFIMSKFCRHRFTSRGSIVCPIQSRFQITKPCRSTIQLCTNFLLCRTFASVRTVPSVRGFETYENIYNLYTVSQFGGFPSSALPERETLGKHGEKYTLDCKCHIYQEP
jgi:hypothetical protein